MSIRAVTQAFYPNSMTQRLTRLCGHFQIRRFWERAKTTTPVISKFNPVQCLTTPSPIIHCCDAGFDMDDYGAIKLGVDSGRLKGILTSLYRPDQKKSAVRAFLNVYRENQLEQGSLSSRTQQISIPVFSGRGYYPYPRATPQENSEQFFSIYPRWPTAIFGDPALADTDSQYKCIYPYQLQPFIDNGIALQPCSGSDDLEEFMTFWEGIQEPIVYVCTGPTTNLAELLRQHREKIKDKIKTIVMMNGTFSKPARMGYNGGLNFKDTQEVLESGIPCIIVPSALCADYVFPKELVQTMTHNYKSLSPFGKLFHDIMLSWEIHRARKKNPEVSLSELSLAAPILADPLTMLLALYPAFIGDVRSVKYTFDLSSDKHLLHREADALVKVEDDPNSTVFEVVSITDPETVQRLLVENLKKDVFLSNSIAHPPTRRLSHILSTPIHPISQTISPFIKKMINIFQNDEGVFISPTMQYRYNQAARAHFYGIHREHQEVKNDFETTIERYLEIKSTLLAKMELPSHTPVIEVVGDSAPFGPAGTNRALRFLDQHLPQNAVWMYGYTGHAKEDGTKCVNAAVSSLAKRRNHLDKTVGNLVGFHSPMALEEWGCTGPRLKHYILVYGDAECSREVGTVFGDDVITSDFLSDQLLLVEGGIQSFRQACNFFLLDRPILGISGLRGEKTRSALLPDGSSKDYFSAPEFLELLKTRVSECGEPISEELLDSWYHSYLDTHLPATPKKPDYDTKQKLLDDAWKLFKTHRLYEKLDLFQSSGNRSKL